MKKTAAKHSTRIKFNPQEFFTKNIGITGLVVVFLFLIIYLLSNKVSNLEEKIMLMDTKQAQIEATVNGNGSEPEMMLEKK